MGRGGAADTTSLLNLGEGHLTFTRERASSLLKPRKRETAFLPFPREGMAIEPERAAAAAVVSSHSLKAYGYPQRRIYE